MYIIFSRTLLNVLSKLMNSYGCRFWFCQVSGWSGFSLISMLWGSRMSGCMI